MVVQSWELGHEFGFNVLNLPAVSCYKDSNKKEQVGKKLIYTSTRSRTETWTSFEDRYPIIYTFTYSMAQRFIINAPPSVYAFFHTLHRMHPLKSEPQHHHYIYCCHYDRVQIVLSY